MIKVSYRVFGEHREFTASVPNLNTKLDLQKVISQHTASQSARLWNTDLPDASIPINTGGVINTFVYNNHENIVKFLHNPLVIFTEDVSFPVSLSKELLDKITDLKN